IKDKERNRDIKALVHLNEPFDYRGYRLFQIKFDPVGHARQITLRLVPVSGGQAREVTIRRNEATDVDGIGRISYSEFYPDFSLENGKPETLSPEYRNPVVMVTVQRPGQRPQNTLAMNPAFAEQFYAKSSQQSLEPLLIDGNKVVLESFEKVPHSHFL